jgi:hypothetical protein
MIEERDE